VRKGDSLWGGEAIADQEPGKRGRLGGGGGGYLTFVKGNKPKVVQVTELCSGRPCLYDGDTLLSQEKEPTKLWKGGKKKKKKKKKKKEKRAKKKRKGTRKRKGIINKSGLFRYVGVATQSKLFTHRPVIRLYLAVGVVWGVGEVKVLFSGGIWYYFRDGEMTSNWGCKGGRIWILKRGGSRGRR